MEESEHKKDTIDFSQFSMEGKRGFSDQSFSVTRTRDNQKSFNKAITKFFIIILLIISIFIIGFIITNNEGKKNRSGQKASPISDTAPAGYPLEPREKYRPAYP